MALEGNAKDFGLSEIFQLISIQKKSGMLSISAEENVVIFFNDGLVISTRDRRNRTRDPFKDYLLRYGFIERDEMNNLQQIQSGSNMDLTDILLSEKYFSEDELRTIFTEQIYETIQEVLSYPKSQYKFILGKNVLTGVQSYAAIKIEGILMESMRRIDEFPEMQRIFPSEDMIFQRLPVPGDKQLKLENNEEIIYELLSSERSLSYLVAHARMARFCTYEALKQLLEKGLLEFREAVTEAKEETVVKSQEKKKKGKKILMPVLATVSLLLASFAIGQYAVPRALPPGWNSIPIVARSHSSSRPAGELACTIEEIKVRALKAALREGLEEYMATKGSYPFTLEVLAVKKIISNRLVTQAQQSGLRYRMGDGGSSYTLDSI